MFSSVFFLYAIYWFFKKLRFGTPPTLILDHSATELSLCSPAMLAYHNHQFFFSQSPSSKLIHSLRKYQYCIVCFDHCKGKKKEITHQSHFKSKMLDSIYNNIQTKNIKEKTILFLCPLAKEVWRLTGFGMIAVGSSDVVDQVNHVLNGI